MRKHLFTPFVDRFTIDVPGPDDLEMRGSLLDHEFTVRRGGRMVATVSKHWVALTDTYGVEIAEGEDRRSCSPASSPSTWPRTGSAATSRGDAGAGSPDRSEPGAGRGRSASRRR